MTDHRVTIATAKAREAVGANVRPAHAFKGHAATQRPKPVFEAPSGYVEPLAGACPFCRDPHGRPVIRVGDYHECSDNCEATLLTGEPCGARRNQVARREPGGPWVYEWLPCWRQEEHVG